MVNSMLDSDARLSLLELKCRRPVEHLLAGEYRSVFRGQGIEFEDVRPYQPGDDVRSMDWKVTARTGQPHIKRYIQQREQVLYLLVDLSASILDSANDRKRQLISEITALLAMAAVKNNDRISLILFTDRVELMVPPGKGRAHVLRIMDALLNFQPAGTATSFEAVLNHFGHIAPNHSVVFVISDFMATDFQEELRALAEWHDLNAVNVLDPPQAQLLGSKELVHIQDAETGKATHVDLRTVGEPAQIHHVDLREAMLQLGIGLMEVTVEEDCVAALADYFQSRLRYIVDVTGG
jgi:uncharacterized protein (DUF58 family)